MYRSIHFTPRDFRVPESEQFLSVYSGEAASTESRLELSLVLEQLSIKYDLLHPANPMHFMLRNVPVLSLDQFHMWVLDLLNLPSESMQMDFRWVSAAWIANEESNDRMLIGVSRESWCVIHWFTTA